MSDAKNPVAIEFGARLRAWREARGWTQAGVAERAGRPVATWRRWEQGTRYPGKDTRDALETLMRVSDAVRAESAI